MVPVTGIGLKGRENIDRVPEEWGTNEHWNIGTRRAKREERQGKKHYC